MTEGTRNDAETLASGYATWHRIYEIGGIASTSLSCVWLILRLLHCPPLSVSALSLSLFLGLLFADFISGLFHWAFDTWGSVDTPVFGRVAIRTFRHHHVDEKAITEHDFIETNGHNFALSMIPATVGLLSVDPSNPTVASSCLGWACVSAIFFVSMTSQIHKWAHMDHPPAIVRTLQSWRVILSPKHHAVHHVAPHVRHYCITVGWMNKPLRALRFFESLEWIISGVTGAEPRKDG